MMRTARILLVTAIATLVAVPLTAQETKAKKGPAMKVSSAGQAMIRLMKLHAAVEALDLTDQQKEGLKKLQDETGPKMKETLGKLTEILSEEQRKAAGQAAKAAKEAKKSDRQIIVAAEAAAKITDEQKGKTDKVGKEMLALQREIMKKTMGLLSDEQKETVKKAMMPQPRKKGAQGGKKKAE